MQGIADWLGSIGLTEYAQRFAENAIRVSDVHHLTEQDLQNLGIPAQHRLQILSAIARVRGAGATELPMTDAVPLNDAERRQLTIMFCDLVGSSALSARLDPEDFRRVLIAYNTRVTDVVRRHNGNVVRYMGDGVLAYFGYPQAEEESAIQATRAGLALIDAVGALHAEIGVGLQVRIGIATGVVVVGDLVGDGMVREQAAIGQTPNLAARLQKMASPGTVLIDANSQRLTGGHFDYRDLGLRPLKGWPDPIRVWHVIGASGVTSRFEARHRSKLPPLLGRDSEMELLLSKWHDARRNEGCVAILCGEPGIGKSHIALALDERLRNEPHLTLRYFCSMHHTHTALFPIIGQLEHAAGFDRNDPPAAKLDKLEALLARSAATSEQIAIIANLLQLPISESFGLHELSPAEGKQRTLAALLAQFEALAAEQPVYVIFEDAHWIDPTSLQQLSTLVQGIARLRVLLLITARPEFAPPWHDDPRITTIRLMPLGHQYGAALVEHVTGGKAMPPPVLSEILARTDGVPLFIEELTKTVLEAGVLREDRERYELAGVHLQTIPATLQESLLARLDRLGAGKEIAQIGAVIGREFSYELLRAVAGIPARVLDAALDRLLASELVYCRDASGDNTYVFKHALVRDAAEKMLLRARKKQLHQRIARALEEGFPEVVDTQPELIAHHFREADNLPKFVRYLSIAGDRALSRSALTEAHENITQALQQIVCLPADATRERDELKLQIALARTLLEQRGYADRQVGDAYAKARELSGHVDDPGMHLAILYGLWAHHYVRGKPAAMLEQAEEFLTVAEGQDEGGPILVGHRLVGTSHLIMGYMSRAIASLDQALMRYDPGKHGANSRTGQNLRARFGQDVGIGIYAYRSWALALAGRPAEAEQSADTALAQSGGLDRDDQSRFYALWHAGMAYVLLRDAERVAAIDSELMELANNRGLPYWQALAHFLRGWRVARTGHAMTAVELFHGGLELWAKTGSRIFRPICLAFLADAHAAADQRDLANQRFREALRIAAGTGERWAEPEIHRLYGNLLLRCSNPGAAISRYKRAIDLAREQGSRWFELRTGTSLARLLSERGQRIEANDVLVNIYQTFDARCTRPDITDARLLIEAIQ
jgi:class 3 adenylate cyclase/tetratricopeptide (TPR) repeat protein